LGKGPAGEVRMRKKKIWKNRQVLLEKGPGFAAVAKKSGGRVLDGHAAQKGEDRPGGGGRAETSGLQGRQKKIIEPRFCLPPAEDAKKESVKWGGGGGVQNRNLRKRIVMRAGVLGGECIHREGHKGTGIKDRDRR